MAKPKLALIPSAQGSKFYSVLPSSGVGDFDFSRSGSATRINKDGLIETVGNGVSRLNYPMIDGVVSGCPHHILEPQRTNLIPFSEDFSQSAWIKQRTTITGNQAVSPDGSVTADKITGTGTGTSYFYDGFSVSSGTVYTISIFAKKINVNNFYINNFSQAGNIVFNLSNGTIDTAASGTFSGGKIENYGNDWYRLSVQYTSGTTSSDNIGFYGQDSALDAAYIWGAQLEAGSYVTSYIPTYAGTVTRSAETANGSGDASTFNDSEGVLMAEISALAETETFRDIRINDGSSNNRVAIRYSTTTNEIEAYVVSSGTETFKGEYISQSIVNFNKIAIKYKENNFSFFVNGFELATDISGSTPIGLNNINFSTSLFNFYGNTKQIQYFDTALTDSELETLTSWVSFSDMARGQLYTIE
jgi:hypothetical protein